MPPRDPQTPRSTAGTSPRVLQKRNVETLYPSLACEGKRAVRRAHGGAGLRCRKKRMPSRNEADTGFDVTRHESEPTSDGCFVARQHEELPAGGNANGDNGSTVDRCALHPTREGSFAWVSRRGLDHYSLITGPAEELAFEGLEPYEGKLSRTVLRGALGWQQPGPTRFRSRQ